MKLFPARFVIATLISSLACVPSAHALDQLYSPYVHQGEWEVEYFGTHSVDSDDTKDSAQKHKFDVGYGVTDFWKTELEAIFEKPSQDHLTFDAWEWENIFQLTTPGSYWVDVGASLGYEWTPQSNRADKIEARLLFQKDYANTTHILNLIGEKEVGGGQQEDWEGGFIWSSRYNYSEYFQPGLEINSDVGEIRETGNFDDQKHYVGPVFYGEIPLLEKDAGHSEGIGYRAGYLFGVSDAAANGQIILQLEYEFEF